MAKTKTAAPATKKAVVKAASKTTVSVKPLKETLSKAALFVHLATQTGVAPKDVKSVMGALEETISASINKKGVGQFTLPGLLKITSQAIPKKPKRKGKDPFTGEERWFEAKPASIKVKIRPLKKLKDAAA